MWYVDRLNGGWVTKKHIVDSDGQWAIEFEDPFYFVLIQSNARVSDVRAVERFFANMRI